MSAESTADATARLVASLAACTKDGEEIDGEEFIMENDDAVDTLHSFISQARSILGRE